MPKKHAHKYLRYLTLKQKIKMYRCVLPDCTHTTLVDHAMNKVAVCWRCGEDFLMSKISVTLERPHCTACTQSKKGKAPVDIHDFFTSIGAR